MRFYRLYAKLCLTSLLTQQQPIYTSGTGMTVVVFLATCKLQRQHSHSSLWNPNQLIRGLKSLQNCIILCGFVAHTWYFSHSTVTGFNDTIQNTNCEHFKNITDKTVYGASNSFLKLWILFNDHQTFPGISVNLCTKLPHRNLLWLILRIQYALCIYMQVKIQVMLVTLSWMASPGALWLDDFK